MRFHLVIKLTKGLDITETVNACYKFLKFQTLDMSNWRPIEQGLHTTELISGLDVCEQMKNRKEYELTDQTLTVPLP